MDLYFEAKRRHQRTLEEDKAWRLLKHARAQQECEAPSAMRRILARVSFHLAFAGAKPQRECQ
jgi:hypothetical protein